MFGRRVAVGIAAMGLCLAIASPALAKSPVPAKSLVLVNELGAPTASEVFVADAGGNNERGLLSRADLDYNASFSADGQWIVFTSERHGPATIFRVRRDGSGLEALTDGSGFSDQASLSPDGQRLAFVSTRQGGVANIWILDLTTRKLRNLTGRLPFQSGQLHSYFRPAWSPDGKWIAFSSDRGTHFEDHKFPAPGWEHIQRCSVYIVRADGTGLARLSDGIEFAGSPQWSPDGGEVVFYSLPADQTFTVRVAGVDVGAGHADEVSSQLVSVNVATRMRTQRTSGPGLKVAPHYVGADRLAYLLKAKDVGVLTYLQLGQSGGAAASTSGESAALGSIRNPSWSSDGKEVLYDRQRSTPKQGDPIHSSDPNIDLRFTGEFPTVSSRQQVAFSPFSMHGKQITSIGIYSSDMDGAEPRPLYVPGKGDAAFSAAWSPDGSSLAVMQGKFTLAPTPTQIALIRSDGAFVRMITHGDLASGFPSWSSDGKYIVYRVKGAERGLRIVRVDDGSVRTLTTDQDNFPFWSPDGSRICFTRQTGGLTSFEIFSIRPDGSQLRRLTNAPGNDSHCAWSRDSKSIIFSSSRLGFRDEAPLYDAVNAQPYSEEFIMRADGSGQRPLTDDKWEQGTPAWAR